MKFNFRTIAFILCILLAKNSAAQDSLRLSKIFIGIQAGGGFFNNSIASKSINSTTSDAIVRSATFKGNSGGSFSNARLILGYRINDAMSIDLRAGIGTYGSTWETGFSSSETNNTGTYSATDRLEGDYTHFNYEVSFKHSIVQLKARQKLRYINARFGIGWLKNKDGRGIKYVEHFWPSFGVSFNDSDDGPAGYKDTKLIEISDFAFTKLGVDYESRGRSGFTFAFDVYIYYPNLFSDNSVIFKEDENTSNATEIYLKNQIVAYTFTINYFVNRLFMKKE